MSHRVAHRRKVDSLVALPIWWGMLIAMRNTRTVAAHTCVMLSVGLWWAFDAEGLQTLAYANAPTWDRSVLGVELPVYGADKIAPLFR